MPESLFADTNLFLRYLTNDVPDQAEAVERLLLRAGVGDVTLVTSSMVIAEIAWTLRSYYRLAPDAIRDHILAIVSTPGLRVPDRELVQQAAIWHADRGVDYADAYNVAWMLSQGLSVACTFDRRHFSRFEGIQVRVPGEA